MIVKKHVLFLILTTIELTVLLGLVVQVKSESRRKTTALIPQERAIVRTLELTDLALWTEARYTRHPSQADFFAPFQDGPSSFDLFPAGSVVPPPRWPAARGFSDP
jgi:hypothetical protein